MKKQYPEIRIKYAWLLMQNTTKEMSAYWADGKPARSNEEYEEVVRKYQEFWHPYEHKVIKALYEITGLKFKQNVIDVYVAPWFYAFSDPLVLGPKFDTQQKLVANLTHELTHRLLMDNISHDETKTLNEWTKLFGEHHFVTLVHIPVHAVMHKLFLDTFNEPDILAEDIHSTLEYQDSWDYVEKNGYDSIVRKLRELYEESVITVER